jgi:uncharacterized protein (DUF4415 family)
MPKASKPLSRPTKGRADLARLRRMTDTEIEATSPPELRKLPDTFWKGARVITPVPKEAISIRLDSDVVAFFRAAGPRYQSRINAVLRSYVDEMSREQRRRPSKRTV